MARYTLLFALLALMMTGLSPHATANPPIPPPKKTSLNEIDSQLAAETKKQKALADKMAQESKDAEKLQNHLSDIAGRVQDREKDALRLRQNVDKLSREQVQVMQDLHKDRLFLQQAVNGYLQMRLAPDAVWMANPNQTREVMLGLTALHAVMPHLHQKAAGLQDRLKTLAENQDALRQEQAKLVMATQSLTEQRQTMTLLLKERDKQRAQMEQAYTVQADSVATLSSKAKDLKDLIAKLEEKNRRLRVAQQQALKDRAKQQIAQAEDAGPGLRQMASAALQNLSPGRSSRSAYKGRLPVTGKIAIAYGENDTLGAPAQGMHIKGVPGGTVTTPAKGTVRYTGAFQNYGKIVLIEHKNGYHSLVAGLDKIATVVGSHVVAGEPLGTLSTSSSTPTAYFEIRHNGEAVDPATHMQRLY